MPVEFQTLTPGAAVFLGFVALACGIAAGAIVEVVQQIWRDTMDQDDRR